MRFWGCSPICSSNTRNLWKKIRMNHTTSQYHQELWCLVEIYKHLQKPVKDKIVLLEFNCWSFRKIVLLVQYRAHTNLDNLCTFTSFTETDHCFCRDLRHERYRSLEQKNNQGTLTIRNENLQSWQMGNHSQCQL